MSMKGKVVNDAMTARVMASCVVATHAMRPRVIGVTMPMARARVDQVESWKDASARGMGVGSSSIGGSVRGMVGGCKMGGIVLGLLGVLRSTTSHSNCVPQCNCGTRNYERIRSMMMLARL